MLLSCSSSNSSPSCLFQSDSSLRHWNALLCIKLTVLIFLKSSGRSLSLAHCVFNCDYHVFSSVWQYKISPSKTVSFFFSVALPSQLYCTAANPLYCIPLLVSSSVLCFSPLSSFPLLSHLRRVVHILFCQLFLWHFTLYAILLDNTFKHGCLLLLSNCPFVVWY